MSALYHSDQPIPNASGIYQITCTITGKFYIGSAVDLRNRWRQHRNELRRNNHSNQKMQNAWNKHGEEAFTFKVIELTLPPFLLEREQFYLDKFQPFGSNGYNIYRVAGSPYGREVSQATRDKIGAANRGKPSPNRGKKASPETRKRISESQIGRIIPPEHREKLSRAGRGRKFSPESLKKRSEARRGFKHTSETKERLRIASLGNTNMLGKSPSDTTREKLRDRNRDRMKTIIVTAPDGTEYVVCGIRQFCKEHNLDRSNLMHVAKGNKLTHKGWKARFPES